tara:strand:+ start:2245 stop:2796 length:552 start_codon:yes stop_codon:yes gene_type:complete
MLVSMKSNFLIIICLVISSCQQEESFKSNTDACEELSIYPMEVPPDFKFVFEKVGPLGYEYKSDDNDFSLLINPFSDPVKEKHFEVILEQREIKLLWKKIVQTDVLKYPHTYRPKGFIMSPQRAYCIHLAFNGTQKTINWNENTETFSCTDAYKLNQFVDVLDSVIMSHIEIDSLPKIEYNWL